MEKILLGLGSNKSFMGLKPCEILRRACIELDGVLKDMSVSSVYRTAAMYVTDQEDFYNMVCTGFVADDEDPYDFTTPATNEFTLIKPFFISSSV